MTHEGAVLVCGVEGADAAVPCASFTHQLAQTRDRLSNHPFVISVTLSFRYTERKLAFISFSIYHLEEDSVMFVSLGRKALRLVKTALHVLGPGAGGN